MNARVDPAVSLAEASKAPYTEMSPSLLSQQPVSIPDVNKARDLGWWQVAYTHLEARLNSLRTWRWSWWTYWLQLSAFFQPRRQHWLIVANRMNRGSPVNDQIINSVGLQAVRTCAAGMWTGLTSPSRPWFKWDIALPWVELDAEGSEWLEDTTKRVGTVLSQSNFYESMALVFKDEVVIGTAPVTVYEDAEDVIRLYNYVAGEYYLGAGGRFSTDTLLPEFVMTTLQIVDRFQLENCPQEVQIAWQNGGARLDEEWVVCYCIEPNYAINDRKGGSIKIVPGIFTWREIYWLRGKKDAKPLSVTGFYEQPFAVFGWAKVSNDPYFSSPCMDCLGDNKQIQLEELRKAEFIEKGVRPPMGADPALKNEPSSILPAKITYFATDGGARKGFFPLFEVVAQWASVLTADIDAVAKRIQSCLYVDLFMAISRMEGVQPRNELELTKRDLERLQELGPVISLNEGQLSIVLNRVYAIMQRRRLLKPMPKSLQGVPLKIKYTSIMRLAQIAAEAVAMKDVFVTAGELSSAAKAAGVADPIRVLNLDEALKHYAELNNYPTSCIFTEDQVKAHDMIRAQEMQRAQAPGQAQAAVSAAKTLSDTQVPGGNALSSLLTGNVGQPGGGQ